MIAFMQRENWSGMAWNLKDEPIYIGSQNHCITHERNLDHPVIHDADCGSKAEPASSLLMEQWNERTRDSETQESHVITPRSHVNCVHVWIGRSIRGPGIKLYAGHILYKAAHLGRVVKVYEKFTICKLVNSLTNTSVLQLHLCPS